MRQHIRHICEVCPSCQKNKKTYKKHGFLPAKEAEADPWERVCVDLIGPFKIKRKGSKKSHIPRALTIIDPATGWFEITEVKDKSAASILARPRWTRLTAIVLAVVAVLANAVFLPLAGKLETRSREEVMNKEMVIEGIMAIQSGDSPRIVEEKLKSFLPPVTRRKVEAEKRPRAA